MGPKKSEQKQKQKQQVEKHNPPPVYEEDYIPIKTLTEYGLDGDTVKVLDKAEIWNSLLLRNDKKLLAGTKGLPESKYDQICEAIGRIMDSLESKVQEFTDTTVAAMEDMYHQKDDFMKLVIRATQKCLRECYTFEEMHETLYRDFGQERATTEKIYSRFFVGKKESKFYKQLSSIRSAQRKSEQIREKHAAAELEAKQTLGKKEKQEAKASEPKQKMQKEMQEAEQKVTQEADSELASEPKQKQQVEQEKPASPEQKEKHNPPLVYEDAEQKKLAIAELEEKLAATALGEELAAAELPLAALHLAEKLAADELAEKLAAAELEEKERLAAAELAEKLAAAELAEKLAAAELAERETLGKKEKQEAESRLPVLSQQVITSQKDMRDAFALQQKIIAEIMNSQAGMATNEDLESVQDGVGGRLESLGKALATDVADEILKELTSASRELSQKAEKLISSKVKGALKKLDNAFKARVETECEARVAVAVANVATGTKERMAMHIVEEEYEECFSMAIRSDKASLGWLLTKTDPEGLPGLQLSKPTLLGLLARLALLVRSLDVGLYTGVYRSWFLAVSDFAVRTDLDIPDWLMKDLLVAQANALEDA
ncbi:hypothetical protein Bca52824_029232 [Brassica carinata]|uniref:Uncharacterized protein n=1 Tax=Brassica carinata TaxID=52824 RepID=A0A8X7VE53_BRACI|nr:hypothetical protein Bca52824_029232 [Brassica carinata]